MEKICFDTLIVETTRRCNFQCLHCMRGDAQDVDINAQMMDNLLDQTELIGRLFISGGEPLLNVNALELLFEGIRARNIILLDFSLITNASIFDEQFVESMKRFGEYVRACNQICRPTLHQFPFTAYLGVSLDRYHPESKRCEENYKKYKEALQDYVDVRIISHGNAVNGLGRSRNLVDIPPDYDKVLEAFSKQRIERFSAEYKPSCRSYETIKYPLSHPDQKVVLCSVYVDVYGQMKSGIINSCEFSQIDEFPAICKVSEPIWKKIGEYNEGRVTCEIVEKEISGTAENVDILRGERKEDGSDIDEPNMVEKRLFASFVLMPPIIKKLREKNDIARKKAHNLYPNLTETDIEKVLPFSTESVAISVALIGRQMGSEADDEIEANVSTDLFKKYCYILDDEQISSAEKDVLTWTMRFLARMNKEEKNSEGDNLLTSWQLQRLRQIDEERKSVCCKYCGKVIQYNGRNIHCAGSGGRLKCEYCGHTTIISEVRSRLRRSC